MFHSDLDLTNAAIVCEVALAIYDDNKKFKTHAGLGVIAVKILKDAKPAPESSVKVMLATPRNFMLFFQGEKIEDKIASYKDNPTNIVIKTEVHQLDAAQANGLTAIVPNNCLCGSLDRIPGLADEMLPPEYSEDIEFTKTTELYCHNIELEGINRIDTLFKKFLNKYAESSRSEYTAKLDKRHLVITPSNSCQLF